jgi:hypothetical protein
MLDVDVKIAIHRSNENKKNIGPMEIKKYIGPMEIKKIHSCNENEKLHSNRNTSLHSGFDSLATFDPLFAASN